MNLSMDDVRCTLIVTSLPTKKDNKIMVSYIYGWKEKKDRNDLEGPPWREKKYRSEDRQVICMKWQ